MTSDPGNPSRRTFLAVGGVAALVPAAAVGAESTTSGSIVVTTAMSVNGEVRRATHDVRTTLLDLLRETWGLTGTKKGCDHGQCGACTVHVGGRRVLSCLTLAAGLDDTRVTTIEGVASGDDLHPMQQAFIDHDALQCGYCTPGQIMSALALVDEGHAGCALEVRQRMSGNLCRCAAYPQIVAAVLDGARRMRG